MDSTPAAGATTRLRGPLTAGDVAGVLDHVLAWVNDPEVTRNLARFDHCFSREEEAAFLTRLFASDQDRVFAIENEKQEYIGQIGVHQIYWPARLGRLGIVISRRDEWGRGHARRAITALLDIAFGSLRLNKIWAVFFTTNARMLGLCERLGFQREGVLREEYFHRDQFHDMVRMSLLAREWAARVNG